MDPSASDGYRTLNACASCARQYDVSHLREGSRVRCECGEVFAARFVRPRSPRHLRCSNCGGNVSSSERACAYCGAEVTLEEKGLRSICPGCWARLSDRAHFCMECGIAIQPQALLALPEGSACPRCRSALRRRELSGARIVECGACGGLWLTPDHFEELCESADSQERAARELRERPAPTRQGADAAARYIPCVACGELMHRRNYSAISGIVIDVCKKHGLWLDHSELEKILAFVRKGGLDRAREREIERLREERSRREQAPGIPPLSPFETGRTRMLPDGDNLLAWLTRAVFDLWK